MWYIQVTRMTLPYGRYLQWNEAQERTYSLLKELVLKLPDLMKPFVLRSMWSWNSSCSFAGERKKVVPSMLHQQEAEAEWGIRHFKLFLAGKRFTLQIDHKPLKYWYLKDATRMTLCSVGPL